MNLKPRIGFVELCNIICLNRPLDI